MNQQQAVELLFAQLPNHAAMCLGHFFIEDGIVLDSGMAQGVAKWANYPTPFAAVMAAFTQVLNIETALMGQDGYETAQEARNAVLEWLTDES